MSEANQCPKCRRFIIGTYCFKCGAEIKDLITSDYTEIPDFLKEMMDGKRD